jgi:hypothetical protein
MVRFITASFDCFMLLSSYTNSENWTGTPPNLLGTNFDREFSAYLFSPSAGQRR